MGPFHKIHNICLSYGTATNIKYILYIIDISILNNSELSKEPEVENTCISNFFEPSYFDSSINEKGNNNENNKKIYQDFFY